MWQMFDSTRICRSPQPLTCTAVEWTNVEVRHCMNRMYTSMSCVGVAHSPDSCIHSTQYSAVHALSAIAFKSTGRNVRPQCRNAQYHTCCRLIRCDLSHCLLWRDSYEVHANRVQHDATCFASDCWAQASVLRSAVIKFRVLPLGSHRL
jgi:hypothetical protein